LAARAWRVASSDWAVGAALFLLVLAMNAPFLRLPHYWDSLTFVAQTDHIFRNGFSPALPEAEDFGHPVLLQEILALVWLVAGESLLMSHLVMLCFAAATLYLTYDLGRWLYGPATGVVASVLLAFYPLFWAQSTHVLLDLPTAALALLAIRSLLRGQTAWYLAAASAMVLTKTTGIALVPAALLYVLVRDWRRLSGLKLIVALSIHTLPLLAAAGWLWYHYQSTGWLTVPENRGLLDPPGDLSTAELLREYLPGALFGREGIVRTTIWLVWTYFFKTFLVGALTLAIALHAVLGRRLRPFGPPEHVILLVAPILVQLLLMATTVSQHRYLLPDYPLFFILAARAISGLLVQPLAVGAATVAVALMFGVAWGSSRLGYDLGSPSTVAFADFIATHQDAAAFIERTYPDKVVLAGWPQYVELTMPIQGYVTRPHRIVAYAYQSRHHARILGLGGRPFVEPDELTDQDFDLLYDTDRTNFEPETTRLHAIIRKFELPVVAEFRRGAERAVIYGNPRRGIGTSEIRQGR
jgi:4-amino-4-deoxy-L-arabinose transferase-like glycosyltransferase